MAFIHDDEGDYKPVMVKSIPPGGDATRDEMKVSTRGLPINILTATTTTLNGKHVNNLQCVGGTVGTVTIYDNVAASGIIVWGPGSPVAGARILENVDFAIGITIVTASAIFLSGSYN